MEYIRMCTDLNTTAIEFMSKGQHMECSRTLRSALESLQGCFTEDGSCASSLLPEQHVSSISPSSSASFSSIAVDQVMSMMDDKALADNVFTFCPRMFHITYQDAIKIGLAKLLVIVLFNQAVSHHVNALANFSASTNKNSNNSDRQRNLPRQLMKIVNLYDKVLDIARQSSFQENDMQQMVAVLAATANNMGHASSQLLLYTETQTCITMLIELLSLYNNDDYVSTHDLTLLFGSICIFLEGPILSVSPAA